MEMIGFELGTLEWLNELTRSAISLHGSLLRFKNFSKHPSEIIVAICRVPLEGFKNVYLKKIRRTPFEILAHSAIFRGFAE